MNYPEKLPAQTDVLGNTVVVRRVSSNHIGEHFLGEFLGGERAILVREDLSGEEAWRVFFHEKLHALFYFSGQGTRMSNAAQEGLVLMFEHGLFPSYDPWTELKDGAKEKGRANGSRSRKRSR